MKLLLLSVLFIMLMHSSVAQSLNGNDLNSVEVEYIRIVANQNESDIYIDFGTHHNAPRFNNRLAAPELRNVIKDDEGHEIIFASTIDALNFMSEIGYTLVATQKITAEKEVLLYYIMKQKSN